MTLKTESPISIEHSIHHRIFHQHHHHHHYHLHHMLDHHQLHHIHNQSVYTSHHLQPQAQQEQHQHRDYETKPSWLATTFPAVRDTQKCDLEDISQAKQQQMTTRNLNDASDRRIIDQLVKSRALTAQPTRTHNQIICTPTVHSISSSSSGHHDVTGVKSKQRSQIQFLLLSALAYILSPIDIIPEAIFGVFGILDDLVFLIMCLFCVAIILLYPLFREMRRALLNKLGLKQPEQQQQQSIDVNNKNI